MQRRARVSRLPDARRRPTAVRPTAARRRRVPLPTWHGLRPPRLAAPAVMGPRTNPSPTACCARHLSDRARIAPTRPACVLSARGAVPRRAYDRSAAHVPSYGHGGECDDTPRDALPRRRLRRAGVCTHLLGPSHAPPRTHSTPTRVACGDTWRCVATRGARRACCTARQSTATRARHCAQGRQTRPSSPKARCRRAVAPDTHVCTRGTRRYVPATCRRCSSCQSHTSSCSGPSRDQWRCYGTSTRRATCQSRSSQRAICRRRSRAHCHV